MNFIELLFHLKLENNIFSDLSAKEIIKIEKLILAEKSFTEDINNYDVEKLLNAIKNFPKQLDELLLQKEFLKMFTGKEKIPTFRIDYYIETEENIAFFDEVLKEDFAREFGRRMSVNDYKSLNNIMVYSKMFSFDFMDDLEERLTEKIKAANRFFRDSNFRNTKEYDFIIHSAFFALISYFPSDDIEDAVISLYNKVVDAYNKHKTQPAKFTLECLVSFSYYKSASDSFSDTLKNNKRIALDKLQEKKHYFSNTTKRRKDEYKDNEDNYGKKARNYYIVLISIAVFFIWIGVISTNNRNYNNYDYTEDVIYEEYQQPNNLDRSDELFDYLSQTDTSVIDFSSMYLVNDIEKGENPFDFKPEYSSFNFELLGKSKLYNKTNSDLIVMQYIQDSYNYNYYYTSYYVPKKSIVEIPNSVNAPDAFSPTYLLYFGKDLANYTLETDVLSELVPFKKEDLISPETRFLYTTPNTRNNFDARFQFFSKVIIAENESNFVVNSKSFGVKSFDNEEFQNVKIYKLKK